jgi:hypothetical protein
VASELLLTIHLEVALAIVNHDFVVHGLASEILSIRMHGCTWNGLHIRLTNVLGDYWYPELPKINLFVVCCGDKAATSLYEGYCVNRTQMLLILLCDLRSVSVVLQDLFVCAPSQEDVLPVIGRMKFDTEWSLSVREALYNFSSFRVPKLNDLVKASAQEASPIVAEAYISHSFAMAHVSPHATSMS